VVIPGRSTPVGSDPAVAAAGYVAPAGVRVHEGQKKWDELAAAVLPDGNMMHLYRRDHEYEILADGLLLMSNQAYGSEEALAQIACEGLTGDRTVLVGGLGLGYTLRATLDMLDEDAVVVLAELLPAIVDWNRHMLGHLADHPLTDHRVQIALGDVAQTIRDSVGRFDALMLDVDNGPKAFTQSSNAALYGDKGLSEMYAALKPGGVLAIW
jgi:spermidine synthase